MYDIAIVLVNYKMKDHFSECFETLFPDIEKSGLQVKVVVVDNHSEDGTIQFLEQNYPQVKLINQTANFGFGKSQNDGIKSVRAKYYFVLNPDTTFSNNEESVIGRLYNFMEKNPKVGMIAPKILYPDGLLQYSCWRFPKSFQPLYQRTKLGKTKKGQEKVLYHHMKDFNHNETRPVDAVMGSAMFVRKKAIEEVGFFDERFWMYYEDVDWSLRMWEAGWPVYYVHDIVIKHAHGRGSAKVPGIFKAILKNKLARVHLISWIKFMWKWKGKQKYYASPF